MTGTVAAVAITTNINTPKEKNSIMLNSDAISSLPTSNIVSSNGISSMVQSSASTTTIQPKIAVSVKPSTNTTTNRNVAAINQAVSNGISKINQAVSQGVKKVQATVTEQQSKVSSQSQYRPLKMNDILSTKDENGNACKIVFNLGTINL